MDESSEFHLDKFGSSTSKINVELLDKVNSGNTVHGILLKHVIMNNIHSTGSISPSELIEEEAYVNDDGRVTLTNEKYKIVQLGNGKTLKMNVQVRSRS